MLFLWDFQRKNAHFISKCIKEGTLREERSQAVMRFVCSVVVDRVSYKQSGGKIYQPPARIIVATTHEVEDGIEGIRLSHRFIAPTQTQLESYQHNDVAFRLNGLTLDILTSKGKSLQSVLCWFKSMLLSQYQEGKIKPLVIVSCANDARDLDLDLDSPYYVVRNLQDYYFSYTGGKKNPYSLRTILFWVLGESPPTRRDPVHEAIQKIHLHSKRNEKAYWGFLPRIPKVLPKKPPHICIKETTKVTA